MSLFTSILSIMLLGLVVSPITSVSNPSVTNLDDNKEIAKILDTYCDGSSKFIELSNGRTIRESQHGTVYGVQDEKDCVPIEEMRSLKSTPIVCRVKTDKGLVAKCADWNNTHILIDFEPTAASISASSLIPVKVFKPVYDVKTEKETLVEVRSETKDFSLVSKQRDWIRADIGDEVHFGETSTIITLNDTGSVDVGYTIDDSLRTGTTTYPGTDNIIRLHSLPIRGAIAFPYMFGVEESQIFPNATIINANITLTLNGFDGTDPKSVSIYRLLGENNGTADFQGVSTWDIKNELYNWETAGSDYLATPDDTINLYSTNTTIVFDVTASVQNWSYEWRNNFDADQGFMIDYYVGGGAWGWILFESRDSATAGLRPKLTMEYDTPISKPCYDSRCVFGSSDIVADVYAFDKTVGTHVWYRTLIQINISSIPAEATISEALYYGWHTVAGTDSALNLVNISVSSDQNWDESITTSAFDTITSGLTNNTQSVLMNWSADGNYGSLNEFKVIDITTQVREAVANGYKNLTIQFYYPTDAWDGITQTVTDTAGYLYIGDYGVAGNRNRYGLAPREYSTNVRRTLVTVNYASGEGVDLDPTVILVSPEDTSINENHNKTFTCEVEDDFTITNTTLYGNWSGWHLNQTNETDFSATTEINFTVNDIANGSYEWTCYTCDNATVTQCEWANNNYTFTVGKLPPNIFVNLMTPLDDANLENTTIVNLIANITTNTRIRSANVYTDISGTWISNGTYYTEMPINNGYDIPNNIDMTGNILYYKLNNDSTYGETDILAYDYSGTGNNASINGTPTLTESGIVRNAYDLDGTNDFFNAQNDSSLNIPGSFTLMAWINIEALPTAGQWDGIISKGSDGEAAANNHNYLLSLENAVWGGGQSVTVLYENSAGGNNFVRYNTTPLNLNQWYHLVGVHNADTDEILVYIDGVLMDNTTGVTDAVNMNQLDTRIGQNKIDGTINYFDGKIDEVAIFNRSLSTEEIQSIHNITKIFFINHTVTGLSVGAHIWNIEATDNDSRTAWDTNRTFNILPEGLVTINEHSLNYTNYWMRNNQTLSINITNCTSAYDRPLTHNWTINSILESTESNFTITGSEYALGQTIVTAYCWDNESNFDTQDFLIEIINTTDTLLVVIPDTQGASDNDPHIYYNQTFWIREMSRYTGITFVIHLGDFVEHGDTDPTEWAVANTSMTMVEEATQWGGPPGNHDYDNQLATNRNTVILDQYLPITRFNETSTWGGSQDNETIVNHWQTYTGLDNRTYNVMFLEFCPTDTTIAWANSTIGNYTNESWIITSHAYMYSDNTTINSGDSWDCDTYFASQTDNDGDEQWDLMVKHHENIIMYTSGHILNSGLGYNQTEGLNANKVNQILSNYQCPITGCGESGDGYLRIYKFTESNKVMAKTYSPYKDDFKTDEQNQFNFTFTISFDSCTPPVSGDWTVNMTDNCVLNTPTDITPGHLICVDIGNFTINTTFNFSNLTAGPSGSTIWVAENMDVWI